MANVIGHLCGIHNDEEVISTGTDLYVAFTCDDKNQKQGKLESIDVVDGFVSEQLFSLLLFFYVIFVDVVVVIVGRVGGCHDGGDGGCRVRGFVRRHYGVSGARLWR